MEIPLLTVLSHHVRGNGDQAAVWLLSFAKKSLAPFFGCWLVIHHHISGANKRSEVVGANNTHRILLRPGSLEKMITSRLRK